MIEKESLEQIRVRIHKSKNLVVPPVLWTDPTECLNEVKKKTAKLSGRNTHRLSIFQSPPEVVSNFVMKSMLYEYYPSQFCMRTSFLPNIDRSRCYKTPLLSIQASRDHRENVEGNRVEDDTGIGGGPNANSCNCCTLHYCRGTGRGRIK